MSARTKMAVVGVVAAIGVGVAGEALRGDETSVVTVHQASKSAVPALPEAPVTMEGVAARLECPDPPDPNGPAPNPPMAGNLVSVTSDPAPGTGFPTPGAAVKAYLAYAWPAVDPGSFVVTARSTSEVRLENPHAALLATFAEGGVWNITFKMYCGTIAAGWRAGRR